MRDTSIATVLLIGPVLLLATGLVGALESEDGYSATRLLTASGVQDDVTYTGPYTVSWGDLGEFEFWAPIGPGQRDGLAGDADGKLYFLVRGRDSNTGTDPEYTGLIVYDGADVRHLVQERMDSGYYATRTGTELQAVVVSPSDLGALTEGHPVLLRHAIEGEGAARTLTVEIVSVDPATGGEILVYDLDSSAAAARLAIDASGVLYVGPLEDGSIRRLTYSGGVYSEAEVPGNFAAGVALAADGDGDILTFADDESWSIATKSDKDVYAIDPATGAHWECARVDGANIPFDWVLDSTGKLWIGLRDSKHKYVTEVVPGGTTSVRDRISDSDHDPACLAAGPGGRIYVMERPFDPSGEIWVLEPDSSGDSGGGKGKKK